MVSGRARLHTNPARWQLGKEDQHVLAPEPLAQHDRSGRVDAVNLEHALGQIEADRGNLGRLILDSRVLTEEPRGATIGPMSDSRSYLPSKGFGCCDGKHRPSAGTDPMASPQMINLTSLIDDAKCYELIRHHRWPEGVRCTGCSSAAVIRHGHDETQRHRQRYRCKDCGARFDVT